MTDRRWFLRGALALAVTSPALAARPAGAGWLPVAPFARLQRMIDAHAQEGRRRSMRLAVVLGVVNPRGNGQLLFAGGKGLTDAAGRPLALDGATPFEIGSIAKVFTACLHVRRHGPFAGTLGQWLGPLGGRDLPEAIARIPLADLARYQPGLPQDNAAPAVPPGAMASLDILAEALGRVRPLVPPGTCHAYSNLGWSLLALAGARETPGRPGPADAVAFETAYDQALRAYADGFGALATGVFRPQMKAGLPLGFRRDGTPLPAGASYRPTGPLAVGAGGIVSTGADMVAFLRQQMGYGDDGPEDAALAYLQGPDFSARACAGGAAPRTAYGWMRPVLRTPSGPAELLAKDGAVAGFTAWMGFLPWQGTGAPSTFGVVALCNGPGAARIGRQAMEMILAA